MVETVCMPGKLNALCKKLTNYQRDIVEKIGLGSLLTIPAMPIQRMLVEKLVENFNVVDRTFTIQGNVFSISPWDVYCILGLLDKGQRIEISRKQADPKWFSLYKQKGDTAITFKYLEERIPRETDDDHFARLFVLYAIGTILAPSSKGYVSSNYLEVVVDVSRIKGLNWARFTLEHLLENLAAFKACKRTGLAGNLALFQVWFFEHFQAAGDGLDYDLHQHPLIRNWDQDKVIKRARLEALKKFGAEKVVVELEPNESKVRTSKDASDQEMGDQYNERTGYEYFENEDSKVEQEEVNRDDLDDSTKDEETKTKESMEAMKLLLKRCPEFHTILQMLVAGSNMSSNSEEKRHSSSGGSKPRESHSNGHNESEREGPANTKDEPEKAKSWAEPGTTAETEEFSSDLSARRKRKIDFGSSPTIFEKVKTRTNRRPSSFCRSPYAGTKQKMFSKTKTSGAKQKSVSKKPNSACIDSITKETLQLRYGIHSIVEAINCTSDKSESSWSNYNILNWDVVVKKNIPRQYDGCSCGIFTIKYMQYWNGSELTTPFSQEDMETIRKKMPAELIMSPLNKISSSKEHVLAMQNL